MQNTVSLLPVKEEQIAFNIWDLIFNLSILTTTIFGTSA